MLFYEHESLYTLAFHSPITYLFFTNLVLFSTDNTFYLLSISICGSYNVLGNND